MYQPIKIFLLKANIVFRTLKTVLLEALDLHTKENLSMKVKRLQDLEITEFQVNSAIMHLAKPGNKEVGTNKTMQPKTKKIKKS